MSKKIIEADLPSRDAYLSKKYGEKALFTLDEVTDILGCSRSSVYQMIANKQLEIRRIGSSPRITRLSLLAYLRSSSC